MINTRLVWFLEKNNILTKYQSGFRKGRTTTDQLIRLESFIRDSFLKGNHVVSAFFYLEKAYDTLWKYGVIRDLHKVGLRGRMPMFIQNFLSNKCIDLCDTRIKYYRNVSTMEKLFSENVFNIINYLKECGLYKMF